MNKFLFKYELKSITKDFYVPGFGLLMPLFFALFFPTLILNDVDANIADVITINYVLATVQNMILAIFLVSFAVTCALEFKSNIPQRLSLFGISYTSQIKTKVIVYYLTLLFFMLIYFVIVFNFHSINIISYKQFALFTLIVLLEGIGLLCIGYGIALFSKSFGVTYAITMLLFFLIMALSGTMGIQVEMLPEKIQEINSIVLPFSNVTTNAYDIWAGSGFEVGAVTQSLIVFTSIGVIITIVAIWKNRR